MVAVASQEGWDHKLMLLGDANCGVSYTERSSPSPLRYPALKRGFAVAANALDVTGSDCHIVPQAESELMTKERPIEEYGLVRYRMGIGGSGESIVQQGVANAYPGIYDGIIPESSFPDAWTAREKACGRGFANRPFDNVGVELGLRGLLAGTLTPAQFADLNAELGGRDIDYNWTQKRTTG
jgi:hypothetical protein